MYCTCSYSLVNYSTFVFLICMAIIMLSASLGLKYFNKSVSINEIDYCSRTYKNNIGHRSFTDHLCYPQIDAVYTWVNGSDPKFIELKRYYRDLQNTTLEDREGEGAELDMMKDSRFRDNDELKYSLRSIEKYAKWIHKVYIVTNGQVPSWLDVSNPKIEVVTHEQIFRNTSYLPTFSSSAIETNLHHIPGLSDYFIYFNDDVFLGRPVYPYDFYTIEKGHIMYYSWDVPPCAPNCMYL